MSRSEPSKTELAELHFDCLHCCARRGDWCTVAGQGGKRFPARDLHAARYNQVQTVVELAGWVSELDHADAEVRRLRTGLRTVLAGMKAGTATYVDARQQLLDLVSA